MPLKNKDKLSNLIIYDMCVDKKLQAYYHQNWILIQLTFFNINVNNCINNYSVCKCTLKNIYWHDYNHSVDFDQCI